MAKAKTNTTAKKPKATARRKPKPESASTPVEAGPQVRVRMYRHGLGDCFLLAFPKSDGNDYFILIDCGVILGTPNPGPLMAAVAEDIIETTSGRVDVLVVTHEHWDHVSGFVQAKDAFDRLEIGRVWFAWSEDPSNETAQQLRRDRATRLAALWLGVGQMRTRMAAAGGTADEAEALSRAAEVLSFFGIDPADPAPAGGLAAASAAARGKTETAMRWAQVKAPDPRFWHPGETDELPDTGGVRVYALGPPTHLPQLFKDLPTKKGRETYELDFGREAAASKSFFGAAVSGARPEFDKTVPFDPKYQITPAQAADVAFFRDHYLTGEADAWRRIDTEWMAGASEFALKLDSDTNNTSLALAFELPDGRVLLFPADAQVGNWESWHDTGDGSKRTWPVGGRPVTAEQLLNRTVFYKVGHHGSHNATLRDRGLEMMTSSELVAVVPVDTYVARDIKRWGRMPFDPLTARLGTCTGGRLVAADRVLENGRMEGPGGFFTDSQKTIQVAGAGGAAVERPLYVDYTLPLSRPRH